MILSETDFYPGLIHLFCHELIKQVSDKHDVYYYAGNPPFIVSDKIINNVISSTQLNKRVREKIQMAFYMDDSYRKIANTVAQLCIDKSGGQNDAFFAGDIWGEVKKVSGLKECAYGELTLLLDEMCDLGIFASSKARGRMQYRFCKDSLFKMIESGETRDSL